MFFTIYHHLRVYYLRYILILNKSNKFFCCLKYKTIFKVIISSNKIRLSNWQPYFDNVTTISSGLLNILTGIILFPNPLLIIIDVLLLVWIPSVNLGKKP